MRAGTRGTPEGRRAVEGLEQFKAVYEDARPDTVGLYLGAGVNLHPEGKSAPHLRFRAYCWQQLVEELYRRNHERFTESFADLCAKHGYDWQDLASELVGTLDVDAFVEQIDEIIHDGIPRSDSYGRLSVRLLNQAPTLKAALCFSTTICERTETSWTFERNRKIGTVVTTNYDFFFGAGWTRYQAFKSQWKVQTPFSEEIPDPQQGTINYIHGYVPYRLRKKKELVLTRESYDAAYAAGGFAARTLWEAANRYSLIFLGTSFTDPPLCSVLERCGDRRQHFAFVRSGSEAARRAASLGLGLVVVQRYGEIAQALEEAYCTGLGADELRRVDLDGPKDYWARLAAGPVK